MTERRGRSPASASQNNQRALQEIREMLAEQGGEAKADRAAMNARMDRFETDLRAGNRTTDLLVSDFQELRRDLGEVRDAVSLGDGKRTAAAAKGAAEGAVSAAGTVAQELAKVTSSDAVMKSAWGKAIAVAVGFTTIMVALNNVPDAVRAWDKMWIALRNEPPAHVAPHEKGSAK